MFIFVSKYWPVSAELMAQYNDGSHNYKDCYGGVDWWKNGQWHRDGDKPAVIASNGSLYWYQNGKRHRDGDKPAWIDADGKLLWYQNGLCHRSFGPAVIYPNGKLEWWINHEEITKEVRKWLNRKHWRGTPEQITEFQLRFL